MDLLITIVNFHNEDEIEKAVDSIIKFTPENISKKIVIVDNSAACLDGDGTEKLERLSKKHECVEILPMPGNMGFGHAHNAGQKLYEADFAAIVNPDILLTEDAFSPLIKYLNENKNCMIAVPRITDPDGKLLAVYRLDPTVFDMFLRRFVPGFKKRKAKHTMQDKDYSKPFSLPFAQGSFLLVRKDLYDKIGGFDERYFLYMEDADLCRTARAYGTVDYVPDAAVIHSWHRESKKSFKAFSFHFKSMIKYFNKWGL
ncbi:MAG: glycosyltransferase family 2 protein [Lachnospiraceae bacterium]|nr:glycosyltransferase family 2 protein [Lachnospiraceae bacterium]